MNASKAGKLRHQQSKSGDSRKWPDVHSPDTTSKGEAMPKSAIPAAKQASEGAAHSGTPVIDPPRFAREGGEVSGVLEAKRLPRLAEVAIDDRGTVQYRVRGYSNEKEEPALHMHLAIDVAVPCQRCLEPLGLRFEVDRNLVFVEAVKEFDPIEGEDEDIDSVPLTRALDLHDLIDEEVLLSLPMAACHPPGECGARPGVHAGTAGVSPFSVLSKLKKQ